MRIQNLSFGIKPQIVDEVKKAVIVYQMGRKSSPLQSDTVQLSNDAKLQLQANRIFSRSQKFSISDYNSLSRLEKAVLRQVSKPYKQAADDSINVGVKVKEHLDKRYGNGGYVFCSIGTSPAGIARVLEFSGVETKYLPISRLAAYYEDDSYKKFEDKFGPYQKFLDEQGLDSETVSSSGKEYLFYDYISTGRSLDVFKKMMQEYFGLNLPNVNFHSADFLCYSSCAKNIDPPQYAIDYVRKYMRDSEMAEISGVPHLNIQEIDKIDECKKFESMQSKMFNFNVIDALSRKGDLKQNPKNKNSI